MKRRAAAIKTHGAVDQVSEVMKPRAMARRPLTCGGPQNANPYGVASRWSTLKSRDIECCILSYLAAADLGAMYWCLPRLVVHHLQTARVCTLTNTCLDTVGLDVSHVLLR